MSKILTAEEYLNNDLKGTHQVYDETGVTLITGIEHSEVCRIMEDYANYLLKAKVESITDEMVARQVPIFMKNSKGRFVFPFISQKAFTQVVESITKGIKQKLLEQ